MLAELEGLRIKIRRDAPPPTMRRFTEFFKGFERVQAVREVFGEETDEVLSRLKIGFVSNRYAYMGVSDLDGNLSVGTYHLKHSDLRTLYLDVVHELVHVKQFMEDRKYFRKEHRKYAGGDSFDPSLYFMSPIEIPAYKHAVKEAKRIGMSYDEIGEYLKLGRVDPREFDGFLKAVGLKRGMKLSTRVRPSVRINRNPPVTLFPFTSYFKGFDEISAVRALFGERTEEVLAGLRVAFHPLPFGYVSLNEEDGYLEVSSPYLKEGDPRLLYFDVALCLNLVKRFSKEPPLDSEHVGFGENPIIMESYTAAIREARRIGLSDAEILEHLGVLWFLLAPAEFRRFLRSIGLGKQIKSLSKRT